MAAADVRIVTSIEGIQGVRNGLDSIGQSANALKSPFDSLSTTLKSVGTTMSLAVTAPLTAWGAQILTTTAQFDTRMRQVNALLGGTAQDMGRLETAALAMGKSTAFSASEAADGFAVLAQAGYSANEIIGEVGKSSGLAADIINLAGAEMISFDKAASITTNTLSQFGLATSDAATVIDKFVTIGAASKTSVTEMGSALEKVGPIAKASNQSLDEMLVALGSLAETGIKGEVAGTALAMALAKLQAPTDAGAAALKELGVQVRDGAGNMRPFTDIIADLSVKGATYSQVADIMTQESGKYIISMLNSTEAARKFSEALGGPLLSAAEIAAVKMEGLTGAWQGFTGNLETLNITLGRAGLEEWAIDILNAGSGLIDMLTDLNPNVLKFGSAIAVAAAATGPIILGLGLVAGAVAAIGAPVALAIAGIAALGAALWAFRDRLTPVVDAAKPAFEFIEAAWSQSITKIKSLYDQVVAGFSEGVVKGITNALGVLKDAIAGGFDAISKALPNIIDAAGSQVAGLIGDWFGADAGKAVDESFKGLTNKIREALKLIPPIVSGITTTLKDAWAKTGLSYEGFLESLSGMKDKLVASLKTIFDQFKISMGQGVGAAFGAAAKFMADSVVGLVKKIGELAPKIGTALVDMFKKADWNSAGGAVSEGMKVVGAAVLQYLKDFVAGFKATSGYDLKNLGRDVVTLIADGIKAAPGLVLDALKALFDVIPEVGTYIKDKLPRLASYIADGIKGAIDNAKNMLGTAWESLFGGAAEAADGLSDSLSGAADSADIAGGAFGDTLKSVEGMSDALSGGADSADLMGAAAGDLLTKTNDLKPSLDAVSESLKMVGGTGTDTFNLLTETAGTSWDATSTFADTSTGLMRDAVRSLVTDGKVDFGDLKDTAIRGFASMLEEGVTKFATDGAEALFNWATGGKEQAAGLGTSIIDTFAGKGGVSSTMQSILSGIGGFFGDLAATTRTLMGNLATFITDLFGGKGGVKDTMGSIVSAIGDFFGSLATSVGEVFGGIGKTVSDLFGSIVTWAGDAFDSLGGVFGGLVDTVKTGLGSVSGWLGDIGKGISGVIDNLGGLGPALGNAGAGAGIGSIIGKITGGSSVGGGIGGAVGNVIGASSWFAGTGLGQALGSAAGPIGAIAGGLLGSLVGSLFGKKPSDKNQFADVNFSNGKVVRVGGQGGDKFSEENRLAAVKIGNTIGQLAKQVQNITGGKLSEGVSVNVGSRDGIKLIFGAGQKAVRYSSVDALIQAAYQFMVRDDLEGGDKNKLKARGFPVFATGGDSIFTRSTLIEVGEAGPERVRVDKLNGSYGSGGSGGTTIQIQAPIYTTGLTQTELMKTIVREAERESFRRRGRRA